MNNALIYERYQSFTLCEMLEIDIVLADYFQETIDQTSSSDRDKAVMQAYHALEEAEHQGCRLENGAVQTSRTLHRFRQPHDEGGRSSLWEKGGYARDPELKKKNMKSLTRILF